MDSLGGTREAPGRQKRTNWTAWKAPGSEAPGRHQGGRKGPFGQPARHQGGTREVIGQEAPGRNASTREAPGRQERTNWTAWWAPGRHQGGRKGLIGQPGRHQGGRKGLIGQNAKHQGGTREAGKDQLDRKPVKAILCHEEVFEGNPMLRESCQRQSRAPSGLLKASLCYGQPAVGPTPGFAANRAVRH